jgi:hypothetical protein
MSDLDGGSSDDSETELIQPFVEGKVDSLDKNHILLQFEPGRPHYCCASCGTQIANRDQLMSTQFRGRTGRAFLFGSVINVTQSAEPELTLLASGAHYICELSCIVCKERLGWNYRRAVNNVNKYKEGHSCLEKKLLKYVEH